MKSLGIIALTFISFASYSNQLDSVYTIVDQMPEFKYGGVEGMMIFIGSNTRYPMKALLNNAQGKMYAKFVVDTFGNVGNIEIMKDIGYGCGEQAKRAIQFMKGMFKPGVHNGKKVLVQLVVPISLEMASKFSAEGVYYIDNDSSMRVSLNALYNFGVRRYEEGEYDYAIQIFKNVIDYPPIDYDAYYNLSLCYFKLGEKEKACRAWNDIQQAKLTIADSLIIKYCP